jgi:uncharacterized membrane protein YqhA
MDRLLEVVMLRFTSYAASTIRGLPDRDPDVPTDELLSRFDPATLPNFLFMSRWLQLPLYIGLILAQCVYVFHFWVELVHLVEAAFGSRTALDLLVSSMGYKFPQGEAVRLSETVIMLAVLALIDVVMISNLIFMVIVGGYETFVSRMNLAAIRTSRNGSRT